MNVRRWPSHTWVVLALELLRLAALAFAALAVGTAVDAVLTSRSAALGAATTRALALVAVAGLLAGAVVLTVAHAEGAEEVSWRGRVARAVLGGPLVSEAKAGATVEALTVAVQKVASARATFVGPTLGAFCAPVVVLVVLAARVDGWIALVLTGFVALVPVVMGWFMQLFRRGNSTFGTTSAALSAYYLESIGGLGTLRVLGAAERRADRLAEVSERMRVQTMALLQRNLLVIAVTDAVFGLGMVTAATGLALHGAATGRLTAGQVVAVLAMTLLLVEPADKLGRSFYVGMIGRTHEERLTGLVAAAGATAAGTPGAGTPAAGTPGEPPRIEVRDLVVRRGEREVLRIDDLTVPAGSRLAVVGPTGAGKSTFALVLQGLLEPDTGQVLLDGQDAGTTTRRAAVAAMAQTTYLFTGSVADNVRLADPTATDQDVWAALAAAHLDEEVRAMPAGLGTPVGEGGLALSGGQAQRVALARAHLKDAPVLVLDEPTADLDARTRRLVEDSLVALGRRRTVVTVDHRLERTLAADLVAVVVDGRLADLGTPAQVRERGGYYADALAVDDDAPVVTR